MHTDTTAEGGAKGGGDFVIQGDICWSTGPRALKTMPDSFLVCKGGKSAGVFDRLPRQYDALPLSRCCGKLVIPGLVDLHTHAPQFVYRGLGMDRELLEWLSSHAFPEEEKYHDLAYACKAYSLFVEHLKRGPNTRIMVFATVHVPATLALMSLLEESGLVSMVGKVNMDRNCPDGLREESAAASLDATEKWLETCAAHKDKYANTRPILTPRFIISCSDELLRGLGALRRELNLPVQSHLCENRAEIAWVRKLCPASDGYGAAYRDFDLFGSALPQEAAPTVMAHCVWSDEKEINLMAERGVFAAHCPQSNANLSSGIAPVRRMLSAGVPAGLGSDIAGGTNSSIFRAMSDAIQVSKLRRTLLNIDEETLSLEEAFYLGTAGGGAFFGKAGMGYCGSFEPGADFDALVINDSALATLSNLSIHDRLEQTVYICDNHRIEAKYVRGRLIK
ncbi:MAG: amidohydrolase family protein [Treponema sp.]|jgi:guanine deaminase|nr:amidohydrolase family protein [Treponema sp.]